MHRQIAWLTVGLLVLSTGIVGCSEEREQGGIGGTDLGQKILELRQNAPIEAVKSKLGKPDLESLSGTEVNLHYGSWQLLFRDGKLRRRVRELQSQNGPVPPIAKAYEQREQDREQKVLSLRLGASLKAVEEKLGRPESSEEVFEADLRPERVVRFGSWELTFRNNKLIRRTRY